MGEMLIEGSEGSIRLDGAARLWLRRRGQPAREHAYDWNRRGYAGDSVHALQAHVVAHLREGTPVENTAADYLQAVPVAQADSRSHPSARHATL